MAQPHLSGGIDQATEWRLQGGKNRHSALLHSEAALRERQTPELPG